jgi:hypothetical protein
MSFNFRLFDDAAAPSSAARSRRLPLLSAPRVVASSAACLPLVVGYQPLAQQPPTLSLVLLLPPPSSVARRAIHRPLLPQPTAVVDQLLRSSCFFVCHLLSFLSSPVRCLLRSSLSGPAKGGGGDAAGALLVPKIGSTKARSTTMACRLRPRPHGGDGGVGRRHRPSP